MSIIKKIYTILLPAERRKGYLLLLMVLIMAILDTAGVASIAPFIAVISNPDVVVSNVFLSGFYDFVGFSRVDNKPIDIEDFMFFLNGTMMENDSLTIQQDDTSLLLKVDNTSIGYNLENTDEIVAFGKFNT